MFVLLVLLIVNNATVLCNYSMQSYGDRLLAKLQSKSMDVVLFWNFVMLEASANDYDPYITPVPDQAGPTAASRAFAIIHGAMYNSMNAVSQLFQSKYKPIKMNVTDNIRKKVTTKAAIMEAAYQTLYALYPIQGSIFMFIRDAYLKQLENNYTTMNTEINKGITVGQSTASAILKERKNDNSQIYKIYKPIKRPGYHQVDPTHRNQGYNGVNWGNVKPFVIHSGSQFRASNIVGETYTSRLEFLNSTKYLDDYNEVKSFGSRTSNVRTEDQTEIGNFWGYDGTPKMGVPPRLYNQIVRVISIQQNNTLEQNARLFAMINYALADAGIAAWDTKYFYNFWRPIVAIRQGTNTIPADPYWEPLGSPADGRGVNFTPGFPSYVSGHSTFGSAVFQVLRQFYGTDKISFAFQSDECNGRTIDSITRIRRPAKIRRYQTFTQAETENFMSRIYLGVHWRIDQEEGRIMGQNIAIFVYNEMR